MTLIQDIIFFEITNYKITNPYVNLNFGIIASHIL